MKLNARDYETKVRVESEMGGILKKNKIYYMAPTFIGIYFGGWGRLKKCSQQGNEP